MRKHFFLVALSLVACLPAARAANVTQTQVMMSADSCQPALPAFDGSIRKRPLAMANDGTTTAFVTCAFKGLGQDAHSQGNNLIGIALGSTGGAAVTVTCTLVNGLATPVFVARTRTVTPGVTNLLFWQPSDFGLVGGGLDRAAMSCSLPPSASVLYTLRSYVEYIAD